MNFFFFNFFNNVLADYLTIFFFSSLKRPSGACWEIYKTLSFKGYSKGEIRVAIRIKLLVTLRICFVGKTLASCNNRWLPIPFAPRRASNYDPGSSPRDYKQMLTRVQFHCPYVVSFIYGAFIAATPTYFIT